MNAVDTITEAYRPHVIRTRVDGDRAALTVLSDIHQGLNERKLLKDSVDFLLSLGERCKVVTLQIQLRETRRVLLLKNGRAVQNRF